MLRTVCDALRTAVRIASATLVSLLPTTSVSLYTWSLTMPPPSGGMNASTVAETVVAWDLRVRREYCSAHPTYVLPAVLNTSCDGFGSPPFSEHFEAVHTAVE